MSLTARLSHRPSRIHRSASSAISILASHPSPLTAITVAAVSITAQSIALTQWTTQRYYSNTRSISSGNHDGNHHRQPTQRVMGLDYYAILEVNRYHLRDGDLKQAYHRLAKQYHPDRLTHLNETDRQRAEKKFAQIGVAYSVLSDPVRRQQYDIFVDLSSIGDQDRMLHWVKINRPPEQIGFEGFQPAYEKGYHKSETSNNSDVSPTNPSSNQSNGPITASSTMKEDAKPSPSTKPKVQLPVFRSS